jgi:tetratricopeptide (TPR) repeat protein
MRQAGWASFLPVAAALGGLAMAGAWSIRAGWADYRMRQETVGGTEAAIALTPDQSEYYARLAWLVANDDPAKAKEALERAVALNPWDARSWIELGLRAEAVGDSGAAEACLLRAAKVDSKFLPDGRWRITISGTTNWRSSGFGRSRRRRWSTATRSRCFFCAGGWRKTVS